jgi:cytidylate kinase
MVIAIDGPSGSGKTTTARELARRMGLRHLDTGAMYRAVTLRALRSAMDPHDERAMAGIAEASMISFEEQQGAAQRVVMDGEDVSDAIRSADVTSNVSLVSSHRPVRMAMVRRQRALALSGGVVLEGRDIGSVVLPGAEVKVYLDASLDVRAQRRLRELQARGSAAGMDFQNVRQSLEERDRLDATREVSPLMIPVGACIVDTSRLSIDQQVAEVERIARETAQRIANLAAPRGSANPFADERRVWTLTRFVVRSVLRLMWGVRMVRTDDTDYKECFIYACNHRSNLDPPLAGANIDREVHFVAKQALFENRLFGALITRCNAIPIRKGMFDRTAMDRLLAMLGEGRSILIFPEGGRFAGDELSNARPGVGYLALKSGCAVMPMYIEGNNRLRRALIRRPRITIIQGKPIRLTDPDLTRYDDSDHFRDFGAMVMSAIGALKDEHERNARRRGS